MGFFSKGKQENPEEKRAVQEVAMRTMQQDLGVAKKGELAGQTKMESVERHKGLRQEKTIAKVAPPIAPVALPHLAEMEHRKEKSSSSDVPEIKAIPIVSATPTNLPSDIPKIPELIKQVPSPNMGSDQIVRPAEISKSNEFSNESMENIGSSGLRLSVPIPPPSLKLRGVALSSPSIQEKDRSSSSLNGTVPPLSDSQKIKTQELTAKNDDENKKDEKITEASKPKKSIGSLLSQKKVVWGLVGGIVVVAIAIGSYFVIPMFLTSEPSTVVNETPEVTEEPIAVVELPEIPQLPEFVENDFKLMNFDMEYDIDVDQDEFINYYQNNIALIVASELDVQDLTLAQDFVDVQFSIDKEFPPAEVIINGIVNTFPQDISDRMTSMYSLVAYSGGESARLGLILGINDVQAVREILLDWEQTMADDLKALYLDNSLDFESASSENFIENIYSGVVIRYKNFPTPDMAMEYAISGNKLILATSKDSMFALIDHIAGDNSDTLTEDPLMSEE